MMRKAADWLVVDPERGRRLGRECDSYRLDYRGYEPAPSTASQTAWALLGLMAAGQVDHPAVARGVQYLMATQTEKGLWDAAALHRQRLSAGVLSALSWLFVSSSRSGRWRGTAT